MTQVERYEKVFLLLGGGLLIACLFALFYASFGMGIHLPGRGGEVDPMVVHSTAPFNNPGVRRVSPDEYEVVLVGQIWAFLPRELRVPVGATIRFVATSPDVIHGFQIEGTRVNMMLIPGQISTMSYRFREPGKHRILCHEYCGAGHHTMFGTVIVENAEGEG